ncbi:MAG: helix-turn-helix transcriptional regulator [Burkholderiales bacterium]|nr:helix-turn-helix transcriptional regulator [Burkholderiales bacterium]
MDRGGGGLEVQRFGGRDDKQHGDDFGTEHLPAWPGRLACAQKPGATSHHLRSLHKARGLSQMQLALQLGVTQSRIAAIESKPSVVSMGQLVDLLRVLGVQLVLRDAQPAATPTVLSAASPAKTAPQGEW